MCSVLEVKDKEINKTQRMPWKNLYMQINKFWICWDLLEIYKPCTEQPQSGTTDSPQEEVKESFTGKVIVKLGFEGCIRVWLEEKRWKARMAVRQGPQSPLMMLQSGYSSLIRATAHVLQITNCWSRSFQLDDFMQKTFLIQASAKGNKYLCICHQNKQMAALYH